MTEADRIRKLEEILIRYDELLKNMVSKQQDDHNEALTRIIHLEEFKENMLKEINMTCTLKDKQIVDGDAKVLHKAIASDVFQFMLFVGAVYFFNVVDGQIYNKFNNDLKEVNEKVYDYHAESVRNATNMATIMKSQEQAINKLDSLLAHNHKEHK